MSTGQMGIAGTRESGQDVRTQNVMAAVAIANIVKSSLGPVGLDKMLVDEIGDVIITNDGATILKQLEVQHPAAKVLVELANLQDQEVGDGTTSVVVLAAEILKLANNLVKSHIHPTSVIAGLQFAKKEACAFIKSNIAVKVDELGKDAIINAAKTSMSSKIIGAESEFFAGMAVEAVSRVKYTTPKGKVKYPIAAISILKAHGRSMMESELIDGYALNCVKAAQGMPTRVKNARVALLDIDLRKTKMAFGVQVLVSDPSKLDDIRKKEGDITKDRIDKLIKAGANVILTTKGIDDLAMKTFIEQGVMAVRRCKREDLVHIGKATGGKLILSMADLEGDESADVSTFGACDLVEEVKVGDGELLYFKGCKTTRAQTILLRGANDYLIDEVERSLHDSMCVVKRTLESNAVVPGGGAVEAALSVYMDSIAETMGSRQQLAVAAFAEALLVIPKTLAINGAHDAIDLVAKLRAYHAASQTNPEKKHFRHTGLDLEAGKVRDNLKAGVLEPAMSKVKMIRFATEAAVTILRIDDAISLKKEANPGGPNEDQY